MKNTHYDVPHNGFFGDGPTRYRTIRSVERGPVHLAVDAQALPGTKLDDAMVAAARGRARDTGRAVAIIEAGDGAFATRAAGIRRPSYGVGGATHLWTDNLRAGNTWSRLAMDDPSVRAIVNGSDEAIFGARPYGSRLANAAFRATRPQAVQVAVATVALGSLMFPLIAAPDEKGRSFNRRVGAGHAAASGIGGAALLAGAIAGRGNPIHSTKWIGMGGAAMLAASAVSAGLLVSSSDA